MRVVLPIVSLSVIVAACADPDRAPSAPTSGVPSVGGISAARAKPVPNTRATVEYWDIAESATRGRLIGDGRDANGIAPSSPSIYDDGACGVSAEIFVSGSGDATMDPTGGTTACSPSRSVTVEFGLPLGGGPALGSTQGSFFTNVRDVHSLAVGGSGERRFRLLLRGFGGCEYLRYENVEGSDGRLGTSDDVVFGGITGRSILVTRLDNGTGPRRWRAESQPNLDGRHVAFCEQTGRKGATYAGAYDIPFVLEVSEK